MTTPIAIVSGVFGLWLLITILGFARPPKSRDGGYLRLEDLPTIAGDNPRRQAERRAFCERWRRRV